MKLYSLVMSVLLLFSVTTVIGQQKNQPAVTRGYYAIGNNAQKLAPTQPLRVRPVSITGTEFNKGYYAIGKNRLRLATEEAYLPVSGRRPVVTKGYYGIGNNADKLKN